MLFNDLSLADKLASYRTTIAFQRTRMAADRTLMAVMRTALSMIGFGFTIYSFFSSFVRRDSALGLLSPQAPSRFGLALVSLGVLLLIVGIANHYNYMQMLRRQRAELIEVGTLRADDPFPVSLALIIAFLLVLVGVAAMISILFRLGPFG